MSAPDLEKLRAAQWRNWNEVSGPKWVAYAALMERRLAPVDEALLAAARPRPGEAVLEIGTGSGATTEAVLAKIGPEGRLLGVDISAPLLERARARLLPLHHPGLELRQANAETDPLPEAAFDLVLSRFGVMFFADPVAAFRRFRSALRPTGRLVFAAWAGLAENPHWERPFAIARAHLGEPTPRPPRAPGPLAFSDPAYVEEILAKAGFQAISVTPLPLTLGEGSLDEEVELALRFGPSGALVEEKRPDPATLERLQRAMREALGRDAKPPRATILIVRAAP
jgi:SAM-dependent methyltransferase